MTDRGEETLDLAFAAFGQLEADFAGVTPWLELEDAYRLGGAVVKQYSALQAAEGRPPDAAGHPHEVLLRATVTGVGGPVEEVSVVRHDEQARGVENVNEAVASMNQVTQANAANSEESASASEELSAQANELRRVVEMLAAVVGGSAGVSTGSTSVEYDRQVDTPAARTVTRTPPARVASRSGASASQAVSLDDGDLADF